MSIMKRSSNVVFASTEPILLHGKKIVCIAKNYTEHAQEMGDAVPSPSLTEPVFFLKPTTSYIRSGSSIEFPLSFANSVAATGTTTTGTTTTSTSSKHTGVHHEIELGVVIGSKGKNVPEEQAMSLVRGYLLALDLTERGLQTSAKQAGKPWSMCKGFDTFCPISDEYIAVQEESASHPTLISPNSMLWCTVNGESRQRGCISDMIFSIPKLISYISHVMTLEEHDVILTGTPSGVGPVVPGDVIEGGLDDILRLKFDVVAAAPTTTTAITKEESQEGTSSS